jgi:SAM-dependent methyltransferase
VTSRSFDEYIAMFDLGRPELSGSILDCSAGVAGFVAVAADQCRRAVAVDPAYAMSRQELAEAGRRDLQLGNAIAAEHPGRFRWDWYGTAERREELRLRALANFLPDLVLHPQRYVAGQLPQLPFRDGAFDLVICSHLLFTWADVLGREWHRAALCDLARVGREVRVFPTVVQGAGEPVPFWDALMGDLREAGLRTELRRVDYEFQVGADQMLVVTSG